MAISRKAAEKYPIPLIRYGQIDRAVKAVKLDALAKKLSHARGCDTIALLVLLYRPMRLILRVALGFALIAPSWRAVIQMFMATLDSIAFTTDPSFKAGKDL